MAFTLGKANPGGTVGDLARYVSADARFRSCARTIQMLAS
jgi:hypothetical protein